MRRLPWMAMAALLVSAPASAGPVTLTHLVGDKDHGPYPNNENYSEHSPAQIGSGDPDGFDWGYHGGGDPTPYLTDAALSWTHSVDLTGVVVDSVRLDVVVIGFLLGPNYQKLYLGSPAVEIPNAFVAGNDRVQTFSFNLNPSVLSGGGLQVSLWVSSREGWGGVDYSELIVEGHTPDSGPTPVPEPASTGALLGVGLAFLGTAARRLRAQS